MGRQQPLLWQGHRLVKSFNPYWDRKGKSFEGVEVMGHTDHARTHDQEEQPSEPGLFGDPEVIETFGGVVYRFRSLPRHSWPSLRFLLVFLAMGAVPASAAVAALVFLVAFA